HPVSRGTTRRPRTREQDARPRRERRDGEDRPRVGARARQAAPAAARRCRPVRDADDVPALEHARDRAPRRGRRVGGHRDPHLDARRLARVEDRPAPRGAVGRRAVERDVEPRAEAGARPRRVDVGGEVDEDARRARAVVADPQVAHDGRAGDDECVRAEEGRREVRRPRGPVGAQAHGVLAARRRACGPAERDGGDEREHDREERARPSAPTGTTRVAPERPAPVAPRAHGTGSGAGRACVRPRDRARSRTPATTCQAPHPRRPAAATTATVRRVSPETAVLTQPSTGTAKTTVPRSWTGRTGSGSGEELASPRVVRVRSPSAPTPPATTRCVTTSGRPEAIWYVTTSPGEMRAASTGRTTTIVPGA